MYLTKNDFKHIRSILLDLIRMGLWKPARLKIRPSGLKDKTEARVRVNKQPDEARAWLLYRPPFQ